MYIWETVHKIVLEIVPNIVHEIVLKIIALKMESSPKVQGPFSSCPILISEILMLIQRMCPFVTGKFSCPQIVLEIVHKNVLENVPEISPEIFLENISEIVPKSPRWF